ncbi:hypothetical protein [Streptomyces chattanoogensis]|uniref:hypothetical protein n=1 Tax=Streptomyces chattanoogensis TaxID=66876 RepID=UPI0005D76C94|nr:hypothetical protein T261_7393 [Streptomyces lydicus]
MDVHALDRLDNDAYERLVLDNAHPPARDQETWELLLSRPLIDRTRDTLSALVQRNVSALRKRKAEREAFQTECFARGPAGKKDWFDTRNEYEEWRHRAANFARTVQNALADVNRAKRDHNRSANHTVAQEHRECLRKLALAVQRHQAAHARAGGVAEQPDYELWRVLDQITVPMGPSSEPTSLRTMLDIYWTDVASVDTADEQRAGAERAMRTAPAGQSGRFSGVPKARHVDNGKRLV